jgi:hypothetical protein
MTQNKNGFMARINQKFSGFIKEVNDDGGKIIVKTIISNGESFGHDLIGITPILRKKLIAARVIPS